MKQSDGLIMEFNFHLQDSGHKYRLQIYIYLKYKVIFGEVGSVFEVLSNTNDVQKSKKFILWDKAKWY